MYDVAVTATDKKNGVGSVVHETNVAEITTEGLQNVIDEIVASGEDAATKFEPTANGDLAQSSAVRLY